MCRKIGIGKWPYRQVAAVRRKLPEIKKKLPAKSPNASQRSFDVRMDAWNDADNCDQGKDVPAAKVCALQRERPGKAFEPPDDWSAYPSMSSRDPFHHDWRFW
mmetsp:Transcript_57092/g.150462  ORF Transcript_57092/g.150462 Transcript_57092/m.150462 type:complete len:103 (-) Transcript_57092:104-412(-)